MPLRHELSGLMVLEMALVLALELASELATVQVLGMLASPSLRCNLIHR